MPSQNKNKEKDRPGRRYPRRTIAVLLGFLSFFALLELALRVGGFAFSRLQEYRNADALRRKGASYRILCLGDSTTALGGKDSYPFQLERILDEKNGTPAFSVVNEGAILVDTAYILEHLEENIAKYDPDMVTIMAGTNDRAAAYVGKIPWDGGLKSTRFLMLLAKNLLEKMRPDSIEASGNAGPDYAPVEAQLKREIAENPGAARAYFRLGRSYRERGRYAESEAILKKAVDLNPGNPDAYFAMGLTFMDESKYGRAESMFRRAISLNPNYFMAYMQLAFAYKLESRLKEAETPVKQAMARDPEKNTWAYSELGFIYKAEGRYAQAEEMLNRSTEFLPQYFWAYAELADCYKTERKYKEAEAVLKKAVQANPDDDKAFAELARLYKEMGLRDFAAESAAKASQLRRKRYDAMTAYNLRAMKRILDKKRIRLVCVQYPMRSVKPLRDIFSGEPGVIFVDNENVFRDAVAKSGYSRYFVDMFAGDFGHCSPKGNRLIAENLAEAVWGALKGRDL